jgi:hypothetical protein
MDVPWLAEHFKADHRKAPIVHIDHHSFGFSQLTEYVTHAGLFRNHPPCWHRS